MSSKRGGDNKRMTTSSYVRSSTSRKKGDLKTKPRGFPNKRELGGKEATEKKNERKGGGKRGQENLLERKIATLLES